MSTIKIRQALETELATIVPALATAWENSNFSPPASDPYQEPYCLFGTPNDTVIGDGFYRQPGIFQVTLRYPQNKGSADIGARAELLRDHFHKGLSIAGNGLKVTVDRTPAIGGGSNIDSRFVIIVRISFYADIYK